MTQVEGEHIKAIANVLGHTNKGLTKKELTYFLRASGIKIQDDGFRQGQYSYSVGLNKSDWLNNCLVANAVETKSSVGIMTFIQKCMAPANYTQQEQRERYDWIFSELTKVLLLIGVELRKDGNLYPTAKADTLDEVDKRLDSLRHELHVRKIHSNVVKYCTKEFLVEDYYHAVHEAAKGIAERLREMTGLVLDGSELFNTAFSKSSPYLVANKLESKSDESEQNGIKELCDCIFQLVRNTTAHKVRLNWDIDEAKALDILALISVAHKYLDECHVVKRA